MRVARRTALILVLVLVVATAGSSAHGSERITASGDGLALTARHDGLKAAAVRLERDQRRDALSAQRSTKHVVFAAAFLAAVLASLAQGVRRTVATEGLRSPVACWWFRGGGRAPPFLQPLTV